MKKYFQCLFLLLLVSCADRGLYGEREGGRAIIFGGIFGEVEVGSARDNLVTDASVQADAGAASGAVSRATSTAFEISDQLGVYLVNENQQLAPTNNRINNVCFKVDANGNIKSDPTVYYPDTKQAVTVLVYYPFQATVADATKLEFAVQTDQTRGENIKKSDFCYARQGVTPSDNSQTVQFTHKFSKISLSVTKPAIVKSVEGVRLLTVATHAVINLNDGSVTTITASNKEEVQMANTSTFEAIVPSQTFAAGAKMLAVDVKLIDDKLETYYFTPTTNITIDPSQVTTLKLTLNDNKTATLDDAPQITNWTTGTTSGDLGHGVLNSIRVHWVPEPDRGVEVDSVALTVRNVRTNTVKNYGIPKAGFSNQSPRFGFEFQAADLSYPYIIESVRLLAKGGVLQDCDELTSASIYKAGDYNLGARARVESIKIGDVWWATGNLVATSSVAQGADQGTGVRIGKPTDGGLYFQFGSLIGWKGGNLANWGTGVGIPDGTLQTDGVYWNGSYSWASDAQIWPSKFTNGPSGVGTTWPTGRTDNVYYFGLNTTPYDNMGQKLSDYANLESGNMVSATVAVGDPCSYYLGSTWRQPTTEDWGDLFKNVYANGTVGGTWAGAGTNWGYNNITMVNGKRSSSIPSSTYTGDNNSAAIGRGIYVNTAVTTPPAAAPDANTLFFPASGYRYTSNGSFNSVGRYGYCWSGSVYNDLAGFSLGLTTTYVRPQNTSSRSNGFPVRCVRGLSITSDVPMNMLTSETGSFNLSFAGTGGGRWTLTETGDTDSAFAPSSMTRTESNIMVFVEANRTGVMRSVTYRLTLDSDPDLEATITLYQDPESISVDGVRWATGSLVANGANGAKIGNRYDNGLTFQFGSLVGWNPTTIAAVAIAVRPTGYTGGTAWTTVGRYTGGSVANDPLPTTDAPTTGIGDACRYYLGAQWRTPTRAEYKALLNNAANGAPWATAGGSWQDSPAGGNIKGLFFPAAGRRDSSDGSLGYVGGAGYYGSASCYSAVVGYYMAFSNSTVGSEYNAMRTFGFPVRCVRGLLISASPSEAVSSAAQTVTLKFGGTQGGAWTLAETGDADGAFSPSQMSGTGDGTVTVAIAENTAETAREATYKLTLTSDPDIYATITITQAEATKNVIVINGLKWATGNLIANGANGAQIGAPTDYGLTFQFGSLVGWNPTTTATVAIAVRPAGYTGGTAWTNVGRYTGGSVANDPLPATDAPTTGIGDPCRYYLGGKWRTPTRAEYKTLFNNAANGTAWGTTCRAYWQASPAGAYANAASLATAPTDPNSLFFPAAGYRANSDGSLYAVGVYGYYWSASVYNASYGYYLGFSGSNVSPENSNTRTFGFPVRCVSE